MVSTNEIIVESAPIVTIQQEPINGEIPAPEEDFEKAQKKYQLGKKNLLLNKYDDAVNNIGEACKVYSIKFGEFAPECAEVYFYYGKALLELARVENTVLGNALNGVPEDTGPIDDSRYGNPDDVAADEKEEIADKVIDAMCETDAPAEKTTMETDVESTKKEEQDSEKPAEETPATTTATTTEEEEVEKKTAEEVKKTEEEVDEAAVEGEDEAGESEDGEDVDEEDLTKNEDAKAADETEAEDISNLQRAWEMFELAKLVFGKNFDNDLVFKSKRIAECLIKLGEISIEQELYEQALIDIKESIRMQEEKEAVERDERMLAESYYQFGLAHQFSEQFQVAGEQYQKSINILQIRIDKLKGLIEQSSDDFEKATFNDEITELEAILPEMVSKLEEIKEQGEQSLKLIKEAKECFMNKIDDESGVVVAAAAVVTEVKDITSLVKSKRKISSSALADTSDETVIKKTKVESDETIEPSVVAVDAVNEIPIETDQVEVAAVPVENVSTE